MSDRLLFVIQLLVKKRIEDVNLLCKFRLLFLQVLKPKPTYVILFGSAHAITTQNTYFKPNSIRVSFKYSPGCNRARSPLVMLTAPGMPCGYTNILVNNELWNFKRPVYRNSTYTLSWSTGFCGGAFLVDRRGAMIP
jgi:hypothetical protein